MASSLHYCSWIGFVVLSRLFVATFALPAEKLGEKIQAARVGSDVKLYCKPRDGQPVRWYYQQSWGASGSEIYFNEMFVNGYRNSCTMDTSKAGEWNLIKKAVRVEDSGIYSCIEDNGLGDYYLTHLDVIVKEREKVGEKHQNADVGSVAVLHCKPSNGQPVRWYYQQYLGGDGSEIFFDGKLINGYNRSCAMDTSVEGEWNLIIKSVTARDTGVYSCTENMGAGDYYVTHLNVMQSDVVVNGTSSSVTTRNDTSPVYNHVPETIDKVSSTNQIVVAVSIVSSLITASVAAVIVVSVVLCLRRRRRLSKNRHGQIGGDDSEHLLSKGTPESWKRVNKLKDKFLQPKANTNLSRWTSDEFVFEVIQDTECYSSCVNKLEEQIKQLKVDVIFGINVNDSRGEIFAKPLARRLGIKYERIWPAVLMSETEILTQSFDTRFGKEIVIGIRKDACQAGDRVVIIDSYVRTGCIKNAAMELIEGKLLANVVANVVYAAVNKELPDRPLYSVFPPFFMPSHETKEGLFVCDPAAATIDPVTRVS